MKNKQNNIYYVIILMVMFVAACKFGGFGGTSGGGVSSSSDPKEVLIGSLKNLQQLKSWTGTVNAENDAMPQANSKSDVQYLAPDKFHIKTEAAGSKIEIVMLGADAFMQVNGKWQKAPSGMNLSQMVSNWKDMYNDERVAAFKNVQFVGEETVDGKKMLVYTYEIDGLAAMSEADKAKLTDEAKKQISGMENKSKIWIDAEKNLPDKFELTTKMTQPKEVTTKLTFDYNYDQEVKIEAPQL